jgi:amino acid adenylation domain-containing protein
VQPFCLYSITHKLPQLQYPITMNILIRPDQAHLMLTYHTSLLNDKYAMIVAKTFRHVLVTLLKHPQTLLHEVDVLDEEQRAIVSERNQTLVAPLESCIHHTIHERALAHPNNPAVCAWDGDFSHGILDQLSSSLADELIHEGIGADNTIPVLLEKTRWTPVAMLAILKSGASFVLMDAGHPLERLQTIIEATRAPLVIASPTTLSKANKLSPRVIELTDMLSKQYQPGKEFQWPGVSIKEQDAAYVVFTSGSTGVPKGAVVAHSSLETAAEHLQSCLYVDSSTRVLQFSSHAWDIPVTDILLTLRAGGCVCIPSDEDRTGDIAQAANRLMANWALLTPTVARLVRPEDFTSLKTLVLAGEAISPADLATWHDKVRLIQGYGPAECSLISTVSVPMTLSTDPRGIGQPNACAAWIVHRDNHNLLAPAGAIGELILEGPIVARGYINNPEQTAAAFIEAPSWLKRLRNESTPLRLYKTGDLVRSGLDGSLFFVGRKDNQVKIRGQRVELGEVEALVSRAFSGSQVVVELIKKPELTLFLAFILQEAAKDCTNLLHPPSSEFQESINAIFPRMRELMPSYMIPSVFLPLTHLPRTPTGKTDRRRLRDHIATLSSTELDSYSPVNTFQCVASTPHEAQLQTYVGGVLQRPAETIPLDEDLFTIGLDSLKAMTLAATARKDGMVISVPTIFQHPRLCDLAIVLTQSQATVGEKVLKMQPNSLIASLDEVCAQWHLERDQILNIIPATYFQRGSIETLHAGYIAFHFARPLDVAKFQEVVKMAVSKHAILRTAFIPFQETFVQLVLRDVNIPVQEISTDEDDPSLVTESLCREIERTPLCFGVPAIKLILIQSRTSGRMTAVLRLNRGQYDGISVKCIIEELMSDFEDAHDAPAPGLEYSDFILGRAAYNTESVFQEWRELLEGSSMTYMVPPDQCIRTTDRSRSELLVTAVSDIPLPTTKGGITMASVAKAAWALCLASQTRSDDLVFAQLVRIRHLPMEGIERTVGPCLNYIPVRVSLKPEWTGMDLLRWVQRQHVRTMTSDTADWDEIVQKSTSWPRDTELGSAVHYLSAPMGGHYVFPGDIPCRVHPFDFKMMHTYPMVTCIQFPSAEDPPAINLRIMLTSAVFDQSMADHLCSRFQDLLMQLACDPEKLVSSML